MTSGISAGDWLKRGVALLENSAPAEAVACFGYCLAADPRHADGLWAAARLEATLERRLSAIALLERLLAVSPDFHEAQVVLARMDASLGWLDRAHARFATLGRGLPSWWEETRLERVAAVRETRRSLERCDPPAAAANPAELARIARGRLALGHLPACAAALRRLEALRPGSPAAAAIRMQMVLREFGLAAALAFVRTLPETLRAGLQLPHARLLHEAGDAAGVQAVLGANQEGEALQLLTLSSFAAGDGPRFLDASMRWMAVCGGETPPSMFAIAAARQRGTAVRFANAAAAAQAPPTPMLQYWDARDIPPDVADCMASWRARNPELRPRILCRDEARAFIKEQEIPGLLPCFDEARHPAMQSDIIRLAVLARDGGLYIDADERCMAPIAPLLQRLEAVEFIGWLSPDTPSYLFNGFLAVRKGSPIIRAALEEMLSLRQDHRERGIRSDIWQVSGPGLITRAVGRMLSDPAAAGRIMLLIDREWRQFAHTDDALAYKRTSAGNWRIG